MLTGTDALAAGIEQGLWVELLPAHADALPKLNYIYLPAAAQMQTLAKGQGVVVTYYPSGPLLEYTPEQGQAGARQRRRAAGLGEGQPQPLHVRPPRQLRPGPHLHHGPALHPGRQGPEGPDEAAGTRPGPTSRSWAKGIEYYPSGTAATMKELAEGSRDIIASTTGWDINPRVLGIVPKEAKVATLKGFHWVGDAHYMVVPKGVSDEKLGVLLELMSFLLQKDQQAYTYDQGYFYPGPAVQGVHPRHGARGQPGGDQGVRPARVRAAHRRRPGRAAARAAGAGRGVPALGREVGAKKPKQ